MITLAWLTVLAATTATAPAENLALGRPYTVEPRPNYSHCTDPEDVKQLTDGQYTKGYFWTQRSTVGWVHARPVLITIDLGSVQPIRGVSFNTAAGVAGVEWPEAITIMVSDDGRSFHEAGELVSLSATPSPTGYAVHRFQTDRLKTHGRYVAFLVSAAGSFTFVDEIEIHKGDADWLSLPGAGEPITDLKAFFQANAVRAAIVRRIRADAQAVGALDLIERELGSLPRVVDPNFRAVLPLNALHAQVFQAQARQWRVLKIAPLTVWQSGLWDPLAVTQAPPRQSSAVINVALMQNEYRAGAFNISNAGEQPVTVRLRVVGLPGDITIHEVAWTDTRNGTPVAAALPAAKRTGRDYLIDVPSGMTRQVWLTFHPTDARPGVHKGQILVAGQEVPVTLHIYPFRFPDQPTLHVGGWDYTDADARYEITPQNRAAVIAHLREHFVDSPWATAAVFDFARFDEWLKRWPNARQYCVFANRDVSQEIAAWAKHAQERAVKPEQLAVLLVDEPHSAEQDATILAWARAFRAANSGVKIWEDPTHRDPATANQDMMAACDVLCPNRPMFLTANQEFRDYYAKRRDAGTELAFYSCSGPVRLLDPYTYHRLQAWSCWQYGAKASYFWAFGDSGGSSSWNEYAARGNAYVPFFLDATSVTPGKHMEALREGVEDYEYLVRLRDRVVELEESGVKSDALNRARRLLFEAADRVCGAPTTTGFLWAQSKDRTLADKVRVEILETLSALSALSR